MKRVLPILTAVLLAATAAAAVEPVSDAGFAASLGAIRSRALRMRADHARAAAASLQEMEALLELLQDPDPSVRRAAVRSLKAYVSQAGQVRDRVLEAARDRNETYEVRREAVKTASWVGGFYEVYGRLLDIARDAGEAKGLRVIAYKSLYIVASQRSDVRGRLLDAASGDPDKEVRLGAIWGLSASAAYIDVRDRLLDLVGRSGDEQTRAEALRSLYAGMANWDLQARVLDLARDARQPSSVRYTAILMLSAVISPQTRDALMEIARRDADPEMRRAAILAMDAGNEEISRYFHLLRRTQTGQAIDPLDAE